MNDTTTRQRVLIVDDDELILTCFQRMLRGRFNIETALGAEQAIATASARGPFAVVVSDMRMPGMTGVDLIGRIRGAAPDTVGILLTGNPDSPEIENGVLCGTIFRVLPKPCSPQEFEQAVEVALRRHHQRSAEPE